MTRKRLLSCRRNAVLATLAARRLPRTEAQLCISRRTILLAQKASRNSRKRKTQAAKAIREASAKGVLRKTAAQKIALAKAMRIKNGYCDICGKSCKIQRDHCHRTNRRRGDLCLNCNTTLGLVHDSARIFRKLIKYLEYYRA